MKKKKIIKNNLNIKSLVDKENNLNNFTYFEFNQILINFIGNLIFKGNKSFSLKFVNFLLLNLKLKLKKNPIFILMQIFKIMNPFIISSKKKFKKKIFNIPVIANQRKKNLLIAKWLLKQFKGRNNIRGIHKKDVLKNLIDTFYFKGSSINLKKNNYIEAIRNKKNIRKQRFYYTILNKLRLENRLKEINKIENSYFIKEKWTKSQKIWFYYNKQKFGK